MLPNYVGYSYLHDQRDTEGKKSARFVAPIKRSGRYEVRLAYSALPNRATNVQVTIETADGPKKLTVNQRQTPKIDELFQPLGVFEFEAGIPAAVVVSNAGADGYVIIDAVQWIPATDK